MENWEGEDLGDDLFSLSPLTSPESSPTATPIMKVAEPPSRALLVFEGPVTKTGKKPKKTVFSQDRKKPQPRFGLRSLASLNNSKTAKNRS